MRGVGGGHCGARAGLIVEPADGMSRHASMVGGSGSVAADWPQRLTRNDIGIFHQVISMRWTISGPSTGRCRPTGVRPGSSKVQWRALRPGSTLPASSGWHRARQPMIDARQSFPKRNQGCGVAEAIRVRLLRFDGRDDGIKLRPCLDDLCQCVLKMCQRHFNRFLLYALCKLGTFDLERQKERWH